MVEVIPYVENGSNLNVGKGSAFVGIVGGIHKSPLGALVKCFTSVLMWETCIMKQVKLNLCSKLKDKPEVS